MKLFHEIWLEYVNNRSGRPYRQLGQINLSKISADINLNTKDAKGRTPLFYTAHSLTPQPRFAIKLLDEARASVNVEDNYLRTPLDFAMKNRGDSSALRRVLVQRGAKRGKRNRLKYQSDSLSGDL